MRIKVLLMALTVALAIEVSPAAIKAQGNSNKASSGKAMSHTRHKRGHAKGVVSIPNGAAACVEKLEQLAGSSTPFEEGPSKIINEGLLWNDARSKCSVGADQGLRKKIFDMATAWELKDMSKVQSILSDVKASLPAPSAETKPAAHHRRKHRAAASANSNSGK
jgi:hypothetical protein